MSLDSETAAPEADRRRAVGRVLITLGVVAWLPYAIVSYGLHQDVSVAPYLVMHLAGVLPGCLMVRWDWLRAQWSGRKGYPVC